MKDVKILQLKLTCNTVYFCLPMLPAVEMILLHPLYCVTIKDVESLPPFPLLDDVIFVKNFLS